MINIHDLKKARKIAYQIEKLDAEIIKLERSVLDMINGVSKFEISMHFSKEKEVKEETQNSDIPNLFNNSMDSMFYGFGIGRYINNSTQPTKEETRFSVNEELSLKMIELYARELIKHRQSLIIQLEKYNVSI